MLGIFGYSAPMQAIGTIRGSCCYGSEEHRGGSGVDSEVAGSEVAYCLCRVAYCSQC